MNNDLSTTRKTIVGIQFLFVAFGATVLMPLLVGLDPATALFSAGVGTLIFHAVTKGKVPIFLGSSFAFIAPILLAAKQWGMQATLSGFAGVAAVYFIASAFIKWRGTKFLNRLFPPIVVGPVIILIGLSLSGTAVDMSKSNWLLAIISLLVSIIILTYARGLFRLIPVVAGIAVGYVVAMAMGIVDFTGIAEAPWFALPDSIANPRLPDFSWQPFVCLMPIALATLIEHVGDVYVVSNVANKDFVKDPGLHRTMLGDGLACLAAAFMGGPPVTTYSEVTGAMQITKAQRIPSEHPTSRAWRHHAHALWHHCHSGNTEHGSQQGRLHQDPQHYHCQHHAHHRSGRCRTHGRIVQSLGNRLSSSSGHNPQPDPSQV